MRLIDFITAFLGLILLAPLLLLLAIIIKRDSSGPALFCQTRIGKNGHPFTCLKFRTMQANTENVPSHEVRASQVTKVGQSLRRFKLDEIPQLINVLRGEMGLVGPRPCLPSQTELINARKQSGALKVLPGITGLAQIEGIDMSEPQRLAKRDGEYAQTRTLGGDLAIIVKTFTHILKSKS